MKRLMTLLVALSCLAAWPAAGLPPTRTQVLLTECPSRETLRASLLEHARAVEGTDPMSAGEALFYAGTSYERAARLDSALGCYERAVRLRGNPAERLAYADALLRRGAEGDLGAARALLDSSLAQAGVEDESAAFDYRARLAWLDVLAGKAARAAEGFAPLEAGLRRDPLWGYRMGRAWLEADNAPRAAALIEPLALQSRGQDADLLSLLERATALQGAPGSMAARIDRLVRARDEYERRLVDRLGGRRVRFAASDGFALGGVVVASPAGRRAAIVLCSPGDTLAAYDSLATALARAGWCVLLADLRGSGWSVGPDCPLPDTWVGREDALQATCARDVREALRALALAARADTSRYVVIGVGPSAPIAVEAAALDPRAQALVLLSPLPAPVERGTMRGRIRRMQRPIFFSSAAEDYAQFELTDALYQAGNRPLSRVADARGQGHGAWPLRQDPAAVARLIRWLDERMPPRGRPAPRPAGPRRG
jgi:tetratricopeptide (TPR) repeat protein